MLKWQCQKYNECNLKLNYMKSISQSLPTGGMPSQRFQRDNFIKLEKQDKLRKPLIHSWCEEAVARTPHNVVSKRISFPFNKISGML